MIKVLRGEEEYILKKEQKREEISENIEEQIQVQDEYSALGGMKKED